MFPNRFFPGGFFASRYWPKVGGSVALLPDFKVGTTSSLLALYATRSLQASLTTESEQDLLTTTALF